MGGASYRRGRLAISYTSYNDTLAPYNSHLTTPYHSTYPPHPTILIITPPPTPPLEWAERAIEEAGISRLDSMATAEERLHTLNAVRLVTRHRDQYWLQVMVPCRRTLIQE